ncbi:MAG: subclass B1 metallo-beta-lactamase [Pedobacter sp.]|nr:MAG: subclass B1 metallo-beta-lactamase [Pedobacter sp.]
MKSILKTLSLAICILSCLTTNAQRRDSFQAKVVYKTDDLIITQISKNAFEHTSYLQTNDFGKVPCNGLVVKSNNETIVFDTPTNDKSALELINWIKKSLKSKVKAIIPTHFHDDCLGGLKGFHDKKIPSYAYFKTIEFAKKNNYVVPKNSFTDSLSLIVGKEKIIAKFFGEGHSRDNVVGYFTSENIMFGGCLIKELDATKGYLGDANVAEWSNTVEKVKKHFPNVKTIIPGHGKYGDQRLLDYTIKLFKVPQ